MIRPHTKFVALRVFNMTRSCVLLRRFKSSPRWTLPIEEVNQIEDPITEVDRILKMHLMTEDNFELASALNILEHISHQQTEDYIITVYDIKYKGKVLTDIPKEVLHRFEESRWVPPCQIKKRDLNFAATAYVEAMEKEPCL